MSILADIDALETFVADILKRQSERGRPDDALRDAAVDAIIALFEERGYSAEDLDDPDVQAEIAAALAEVWPEWTDALRAEIVEHVGQIVERTQAFYADQGLDLDLRQAARRSQLTAAITEQLEQGLQSVRETLAKATVTKTREMLLAGVVSTDELARRIEQEAGASTRTARVQAAAAVTGYNQAHRNIVAERAGLEYWVYWGTLQVNSRAFCRIHLKNVFPTTRIEQMKNGMLEPVRVFKGGYNCRHSWLPVNPEWDAELKSRIVDVEPTKLALDAAGNRTITVVAGPAEIARAEAQIALARKSFVYFENAESNPDGFVAADQAWWTLRFAERAGTQRRRHFDELLERARDAAERGEVVQLGAANATPVSAALKAQSTKSRRTLTRVLDAVHDVHDDGVLPTIPYSIKPPRAGEIAAYASRSRRGRYQAVEIYQSSKHADHQPELSLAHELGHFLDQQGLSPRGFRDYASESSDTLLDTWRTAIETSDAYKRVVAIEATGLDPVTGTAYRTAHAEYLLRPRELFARSYAQYLATRSGNRQMREQLDEILGSAEDFEHWTDDDFAPIADAFDHLFDQLLWRQTQRSTPTK
ncbi:MAG: hypothetical protein AAGN64_08195 [Bacteroidota bacterium]